MDLVNAIRPVKGGYVSYGQLAGVLMLASASPRVPGDLGHALTFDFPVRYAAVKAFPFNDLVEGKPEHLDLVVEAVQGLKRKGYASLLPIAGYSLSFTERSVKPCTSLSSPVV